MSYSIDDLFGVPVDSLSPVEQLQMDVAAKLASEAYFSDVPIFLFRPRKKLTAMMIQQAVDAALGPVTAIGGKSGAAGTVYMPVADVPNADPSGPQFVVSIIIRWQELPFVNMGDTGTKKSAESLALHCLNILHKWNPGNGMAALAAPSDAYTPNGEFDPKVTYDTKVVSRFGLVGDAKVATPRIAGNVEAVQLSCSTPDAIIYYTTDSGTPTWQNPDAALYTETFTVEAGTVVRAAAYKPETHQGSDVATHTF